VSDDTRKHGGDKLLLPELLPAPSPVTATLSPSERVAARARVFVERFRGLGTTAAAAVLSIQCGYGVVDPLPPPPPQCSASSDPFAALYARGLLGTRQGDVTTVVLELHNDGDASRNFVGFRIDSVRVTGGTVVKTEDFSKTGPGGYTSLVVTLLPDSASTTMMIVDVDLGCSGARVTKHYQVLWGTPQQAGGVVVVEGGSTTDGGVPDGSSADGG
jgi:hypothetical protein